MPLAGLVVLLLYAWLVERVPFTGARASVSFDLALAQSDQLSLGDDVRVEQGRPLILMVLENHMTKAMSACYVDASTCPSSARSGGRISDAVLTSW